MTEYTFSSSMGACADRLGKLREKKAAQQLKVDAIDDEMKALEKHIIAGMDAESTGAEGKAFRIRVRKKERAQVKDWDALYEYVRKNKAYDLLQKRISEPAINARIEAGKKVPGLGSYIVKTVSLTKR